MDHELLTDEQKARIEEITRSDLTGKFGEVSTLLTMAERGLK